MNIIINPAITLQPIALSDAPVIFHTIDSQREYLGEWLPFVHFTNRVESTEKFIKSLQKDSKEKGEIIYVILYENQFAGLIGFKDRDKINRKIEIGYWLSQPFQKKGIITQSVHALCKYAFDEMNINRIQIKVAVGNLPSRKIPQRLNFKFEGIERDGELMADENFTDVEVYSILKKEFDEQSHKIGKNSCKIMLILFSLIFVKLNAQSIEVISHPDSTANYKLFNDEEPKALWLQFGLGGSDVKLKNENSPPVLFKFESSAHYRWKHWVLSIGSDHSKIFSWTIQSYWSTIGLTGYQSFGCFSANIGLAASNWNHQPSEGNIITSSKKLATIFKTEAMLHLIDGYTGIGMEYTIHYDDEIFYTSLVCFIALGNWNIK